ncbi:transposable element Tcb1 transposase [Trichonephila clavipes]|nr:transposable element Tcb1 transposase [Trichonephila clavipes]
MVWGAIAYNTRSPLALIWGTMTAQRYVHDLLQPHVLPLMQRLPGAIFQQNNALLHTARVSQDYLHTVTNLSCPSRSPDLSPVEQTWDNLERDKYRFQLSPDGHRRLVWRCPAQRSGPAFTIALHTGPQPEVMVWGAISFDSQTPLTARGGRVRSTTPAEDKYIVLSAKRNRPTTAQQVANQFLAASGKQISRKTVARRLRGGGLYARRPVVCVPLTRQHRTARLQWCREHHNWTEQDRACVLFSDESRFSLSSDCRRQLICRESGTAYRPENIQEKDRYPTCSIMVWDGIMINGRTRLHVVANGTTTGQRYIDEVLLPHDCLDSEGIQRLVWPARSPDLNPIENVWDALGRQVAGRNYPPTSKNTLIRAVPEEWDKLPQQLLDNVVQSMV